LERTIRQGVREAAWIFVLGLAAAISIVAQAARDIDVSVVDETNRPVARATVVLNLGSAVTQQTTGADGHAHFAGIKPAKFSLTVSHDGYLPLTQEVSPDANPQTTVAVALHQLNSHKEQVEVKATPDALEQTSSSSTLPVGSAKQLPSHPATVSDALPLLPGVARTQEGSLQISGAGEHRSALLVNSADVTDPATGEFGQTVPIDSVESLSVFQTPFRAEYGRFSAGLVSVETRRGSDTWKWELNDPFPDFRIRSWQLRGIKDATPRLNFEGPLLPGKLFFSEGFEYQVKKVETITLPFPFNQRKTQGFNSFSQVDFVLSDKQLITATVHVAPYRQQNVNIGYFNPEPVTPDASTHDITTTLADKWTVGEGDLFENTLSYTRFTAGTWAKGPLDMTITPTGNFGDYFAQQQRRASRVGLSSAYSLHSISLLGSHNVKFGSYFAGTMDRANVNDRPVNIEGTNGQLLERIGFTGGSLVSKTDTEIAFYGQDHWLITPKLAVDAGIRAESQEISETLRIAPRLGLAYTPFSSTGTVLRGGAGLFYDRVPLDVYGFSQYPEQVVTTYGAGGGIATGPTTYYNELGVVTSRSPFIFGRNTAGNFSPHSTTWSFEVEQPVTRIFRIRASFMGSESAGLVNINPIAPSGSGTQGVMLLTGDSQSRYHQFEVTGRIRLEGDKQELFLSYVRSRARGDLNDFDSYLGNFPAPLVRPNQFGNLPTDLPNRIVAWGLFHLPYSFMIAPVIEFRSGFPYAVTNADQAYVGTPFSARYPDFVSVDSRFSKDFSVSPKYKLRFSISGFNLTNHFNPESAFTNIAAPAYGTFFADHKRRFTADFDVIF
jgi:Carboxypeptidase regulatory-like domain